MFIREAKSIADQLVLMMSPFCNRIEIAGSIRRVRQDVKDIEIVAIPKWEERPCEGAMPLLGTDTERFNLLHEWATRETGADGGLRNWLRWIKPGTKEVIDWPPKADGKYWRGLIDERIKLDLFLASPGNFGLIYLIRTGCAQFSQGVMTYAKHNTRYRITDGHLCCEDGTRLLGCEEGEVFDALGLDYVAPSDRSGAHMVRVDGREQFPVGWGEQWATRVGK